MLIFKQIKSYATLTVFLIILFSAANIFAADAPGSGDHALVKRVSGSEIFFHSQSDFDQLKITLEKIEWNGAEGRVKDFKSLTVEGQQLTNYYKLPEKIGTLEAWRNYEQDLSDSGFELLFSAQGENLETVGYNNQTAREVLDMKGTYGSPEEKAQWPFQHTDENKAAYIAARKITDVSEIYVSAYIVPNTHDNWLEIPVGRTLVRLDVCEVKKREQRMELVKSEEMANQISLNGRIALYGIQFDFNSANIKSESEETLTEIAKLLTEQNTLNILVVGHTDTVGSFEYNKNLSQKRAESVAANLQAKGINSKRLFPVGVSFASPVATNHSEDGRAKNRRVELVDMAGAED